VSRPAVATATVLGALVLALGAVGCGGGSSSTASTAATTATAATTGGQQKNAATKPKQGSPSQGKSGGANRKANANVPPQVHELDRQFSKPTPTAGLKGAASALAAGQKACKGKTPLQVREEFLGEAEANLSSDQMKLIKELPAYQKRDSKDPSFAAGQLGATVYSMTLPEESRPDGYKGCVYALAQQLKGELSGSQ
jgi:hypothetical protein